MAPRSRTSCCRSPTRWRCFRTSCRLPPRFACADTVIALPELRAFAIPISSWPFFLPRKGRPQLVRRSMSISMAETNHPVLKRLAAPFGITSSTVLWRPFAMRQHRRKIDRDSAYRAWLQSRSGLDEHWGHETVTDELGLLHMGSQLYEICRTLRARIGSAAGARVLDAGASDGLFLNEIGAVNGVGVNFLPACARKISADEQLACVADVERLPFPDRAFDIVICCETLEHVPNPVSALNELARVC